MKRFFRQMWCVCFLLVSGVIWFGLGSTAAQTNASEIVLYASTASVKVGNFSNVSDSSAAGGTRIYNADLGAAKLANALTTPSSYFEMSFNAQAGVPYRLWVRSKADNNSPYNDSYFVQFSGSVTSGGAAVYRIGSTEATTINLEDCSGCGLSGWGWQDNGWGVGVMGPVIYFQSTGTQTLRVQAREDGFSIDQIVLSPQTYLNSSPGALKNDSTILPSTIGGSNPPPPNQPPQVTISASVTSGLAPLTVYFVSNAYDPDGYIAAYNWNFGDGQTSTQVSPGHLYSTAGNFTARLTVTDGQGATASATTIIAVTNAAPPPTGGGQLRAITWNAQFGNGTDGVYDLNRQATYMANQSPDIIGMYEVEQSSVKNMPQQLTSLMTQKTGVTWNYYWIGKYAGCTEGNLIMTKWQIVSTSYRYLSTQRSVAQLTLNINGKLVNFFTTHLDPDSSATRSTQVNELKNFMSGFAEPRIVAGDFNAGPDLGEIASMTASYYDSWNEAMNAGTATAYPDNPVVWMTRTRRGRIDYIFSSRGASNVTLMSAKIPDLRDMSQLPIQYIGTPDDLGVRPSDHNMAVATYQIN